MRREISSKIEDFITTGTFSVETKLLDTDSISSHSYEEEKQNLFLSQKSLSFFIRMRALD